jgi:hypothetical protein
MKKTFLSQMLSSGMTGEPSSKRTVLVWFVLLFSATVIVNLHDKQKVLESTLQAQLFYLVIASMAVVFGEPFMKFMAEWKGQKTTSTTTTVAPSDSTVVTTETTKEPEKKTP